MTAKKVNESYIIKHSVTALNPFWNKAVLYK